MTTSSKEFISVIMNCHNGEKFLDESISSVINQSFSNWELIFLIINLTIRVFKLLNHL